MKLVEPIRTVELFLPLGQELLSLLRAFSLADWTKPTVCAAWTVKDVAGHLLGGSLGRLWDDTSRPLRPPGLAKTYDELVTQINRNNDEWVRAAERISPDVLIDFLELTDHRLYAHFCALDDQQPARVAVAWAGQSQSPNWFDIAREYTEKWLHQQHIREAVGQSLLITRQWLYPVLDTFLRGLPYTYRTVEADEGVSVTIRIVGNAGGEWSLRREGTAWQLYSGLDPSANSIVSMSQDIAWRLFSKGVRRESIERDVEITGDALVGAKVLELVSIMA